MSDARARLLGRIAHDVGKYVARTARNIRGDDVPPVLLGMLAKDLYELSDGERASTVLARLCAEAGDALAGEDAIARCRALLAEADELEPEVRAGRGEAVTRAAAIACEVHDLLRQAALRARDGRG